MARDVNKILERLEDVCQKIDDRKNGEQDRKLLIAIGNEKIKRALEKMSLARFYKFLRGNGYKGSIASLRDNLAQIGAREKEALPEQMRCCKCRKPGCGGRLRPVLDNERNVRKVICSVCGAEHGTKGRKIILLQNSAEV